MYQEEQHYQLPGKEEASIPVSQLFVSRPKRQLTAYNFFFQQERQRVLDTLPAAPSDRKSGKRGHGKISFSDLARTIAAKWKTLEAGEKAVFERLAEQDQVRYMQQKKLFDVVNGNNNAQNCNSVKPSKSSKFKKSTAARARKSRPVSMAAPFLHDYSGAEQQQRLSQYQPRFQFSLDAPSPMDVASPSPMTSQVSLSSSSLMNDESESLSFVSEKSYSSPAFVDPQPRPILDLCQILKPSPRLLVHKELLQVLSDDMGQECQTLFMNLFS